MTTEAPADWSKCQFQGIMESILDCPHMKVTYESMAGERYRCPVCEASVWIDYEEIR